WEDKQLVDKVRKSHSVNRALMANFFTEKDIAIIDGEYLFDTEQTIKMPDWKMDPELTKELVQDGELKLKLSKVVKAVKNDQDILDTLNDQNINRRKWTSSDEWGWKDYVGSVVIGLITIMILIFVYFHTKLQRMAAALTAVQMTIRKVATQELEELDQAWVAGELEKTISNKKGGSDKISSCITQEQELKMITHKFFQFIKLVHIICI